MWVLHMESNSSNKVLIYNDLLLSIIEKYQQKYQQIILLGLDK